MFIFNGIVFHEQRGANDFPCKTCRFASARAVAPYAALAEGRRARGAASAAVARGCTHHRDRDCALVGAAGGHARARQGASPAPRRQPRAAPCTGRTRRAWPRAPYRPRPSRDGGCHAPALAKRRAARPHPRCPEPRAGATAPDLPPLGPARRAKAVLAWRAATTRRAPRLGRGCVPASPDGRTQAARSRARPPGLGPPRARAAGVGGGHARVGPLGPPWPRPQGPHARRRGPRAVPTPMPRSRAGTLSGYRAAARAAGAGRAYRERPLARGKPRLPTGRGLCRGNQRPPMPEEPGSEPP